ncbi:hypothetical protein AVEN_102619-1 [Araneus ventricosus]|uniref:Uncharacterized protein n=1 Tax=Araneus ventricosus TaxID=182803 RepID=A0A4Y2BL15_ARAVE|nr:hypothetical protein AVEN_102619-1 [Araneus ventricosus]
MNYAIPPTENELSPISMAADKSEHGVWNTFRSCLSGAVDRTVPLQLKNVAGEGRGKLQLFNYAWSQAEFGAATPDSSSYL